MTAQNGVHDFDFLAGDWTILNKRRKVKSLLDDPAHNKDAPWDEFPAKQTGIQYLDGAVLIDHFEGTFPSGQLVKGITIRAYDKLTGLWSVVWMDNRFSPDFRPLLGKFDDGVGVFEQDIEAADGTPMKVRFTWDNITADGARWAQAFSLDGGETWDTNWTSEFTRVK
jgi:hypothetical protein